MLRRTRTTKKLAKRIDLQYFTRPHALRSWRFWLSVAAPGIALLWFATQYARGGQRVYSSGPLAPVHAVFSKQCNLCHTSQGGVFFRHVTDQACLTCHDAPAHQGNQAFTPQCNSCHIEHKGALQLASTSEAACTECHANLQTLNGEPHYAKHIRGFDRSHPQFSILTVGHSDPAGIKLNHYLHLQPNLAGPNGSQVQMVCEDCHQTGDSHEALHYSEASFTAVAAGVHPIPDSLRLVRDKSATRYMRPSNFTQHCAGCHTLQFDRRFGATQVPHDTPAVIHAFLTKQFSAYVAAHPSAIHEIDPPPLDRQIPERVHPQRIARNSVEWTQFRVADAEGLLWAKSCKQCHSLIQGSGPLPEIAKSNITERWLAHAQFDHHAHQMLSCAACHANPATSHNSSDILLPGIETCQRCHREAAAKNSAADARCSECHSYHDWSKAKPTHGGFSIPQVIGQPRAE